MIPKHIFQIALGDAYVARLPLDRIRSHLTSLNPSYSYTLLTDRECRAFLEEFFPEHIPLYERIERVQYKSDLLRYLYLYKHGGFYVDIDLCPLIPFDILQAALNCDLFVSLGAHHGGRLEVANGFLGAAPSHPLFVQLVEELGRNPNPADYGANVKAFHRHLRETGYTMEPFTKSTPAPLKEGETNREERNVFLLREVGPIQGKYYITHNGRDVVCLSNGHGYPHTLPPELLHRRSQA